LHYWSSTCVYDFILMFVNVPLLTTLLCAGEIDAVKQQLLIWCSAILNKLMCNPSHQFVTNRVVKLNQWNLTAENCWKWMWNPWDIVRVSHLWLTEEVDTHDHCHILKRRRSADQCTLRENTTSTSCWTCVSWTTVRRVTDTHGLVSDVTEPFEVPRGRFTDRTTRLLTLACLW